MILQANLPVLMGQKPLNIHVLYVLDAIAIGANNFEIRPASLQREIHLLFPHTRTYVYVFVVRMG